MATYHGDLMHKTGNVYRSVDDRNYPVAMLLALFLGPIGIHRFFLGDMRVAFCYFVPFAILALMGFAMLSFTLLLWYLAIAWPMALLEFCYFAWRWLQQ